MNGRTTRLKKILDQSFTLLNISVNAHRDTGVLCGSQRGLKAAVPCPLCDIICDMKPSPVAAPHVTLGAAMMCETQHRARHVRRFGRFRENASSAKLGVKKTSHKT